jgi:hypothetical protein
MVRAWLMGPQLRGSLFTGRLDVSRLSSQGASWHITHRPACPVRQSKRCSALTVILSGKIGTCREDGKHRSPLGSLPPDESGGRR